MRDRVQALLIIAIASGILIGTLTISRALQPTYCACGVADFGPTTNCIVGPCPSREMITMESYRIESPTNVTITILNTGSIAINLASYTVRDSNGAQFANTSWTGPLIYPNQNMTANILIDRKSFTFQTRSSYTITVVTSRSNPFTFNIT